MSDLRKSDSLQKVIIIRDLQSSVVSSSPESLSSDLKGSMSFWVLAVLRKDSQTPDVSMLIYTGTIVKFLKVRDIPFKI